MAINSTHPQYDDSLDNWLMMRHAYEGEHAVKAAGEKYLPSTPGQRDDGTKPGQEGAVAYEAYKKRAVFPDFVREAVVRYLGMLHRKEPNIELPPAMEPLRDRATQQGESLLGLLRRINEQQLVTGRLGLLADFPAGLVPAGGPAPLPYIALYTAEACRNWDSSSDFVGVDGLTLVVLDESGYERNAEFEWERVERYRVLKLGTAAEASQQRNTDADDNGTGAPAGAVSSSETTGDADVAPNDPTEGVGVPLYLQGTAAMRNGTSTAALDLMAPMYRGATLDRVPFVFINGGDIVPAPDRPPLLGLGQRCMKIYRGEADYRYTLFMQGQDTFVTIGTVMQGGEAVDGDAPLRLGAGARLSIVDPSGDAKYVGIGAEGLAEQREALAADYADAEAVSGVLVSPKAGKQESGDALSTRLAAQTTSLTDIAKAGAAGLEYLLRVVARWMGQDPEKVKVTPNLEFATQPITGQELTGLMTSRAMGMPLSLESIHGVLRDRGLTKMEFEQELDAIAEEDADRAKRMAALPAPPAPAPAPGPTPPKRGA